MVLTTEPGIGIFIKLIILSSNPARTEVFNNEENGDRLMK